MPDFFSVFSSEADDHPQVTCSLRDTGEVEELAVTRDANDRWSDEGGWRGIEGLQRCERHDLELLDDVIVESRPQIGSEGMDFG